MDGLEARRILDEYFPRRTRTRTFNYSTKKYNIIGFGTEDITEYKHCPLDPGIRLQKIRGQLMCGKCGYTYKKEDAPNDEGISIKHVQKTAIVSGKRKRRYFDKVGNEINDPDLIQEIQQGANVIYYNEVKSGEDKTVDSRNRRIIRKGRRNQT